jgi:protocatechuate 3,4-dioxygenase beta subunit
MYAPKGQYKVNVWPPFNSHYIFFEQKILDVTADMQMNIVLQTGLRLSGVITTTSGAPVSGAVVWLSNTAQGTYYFCGWYSRSDGTYFVTAPPGTYTLKIQPKPGLNFPSYTEVITITGDQVRNFVIGNQNNQANTNTHSTTLSIALSYNSLQPGSLLHLSGKLLDQNQNPLADKTIILSYAVANTGTYTPIGSATTDSSGLYKIDWLIPASGTFTLKVDWAGNTEYNPASATTTLTFSAT